MLPQLIVVGAMKSGTSSLYHYLAANPALAPARLKEVDFFRSENDFAQGLDWYESLFPADRKCAYDVSPNYTKRHLFPGVAERMWKVVPDARLVYVVRDPVARAVSHYVHSSASGSERRSFSEAIRTDGSNYVLTSRYFFQIEAYLEFYDRDRILVLPSEDLSNDPAGAARRVCRFAGVPEIFDESVFEHRFHESAAKRRASILERGVKRSVRNPLARARIRSLAAPVTALIRRRAPELIKPTLTPSDGEFLRQAFAEDARLLRQCFDLELPEWSI